MRSGGRRAYFAYGSNTVREIMRTRAPGASFVCSARLDHFQWVIAENGYASVAPKSGSAVFGLLWTITARDKLGLDLAEGVQIGAYVKRSREVITQCGKTLSALTYEVPSLKVGRRPQRGYVEEIITALTSDEFVPVAYLQELASWLR